MTTIGPVLKITGAGTGSTDASDPGVVIKDCEMVAAPPAAGAHRSPCPRVLQAFLGQPWACHPDKMLAICEFLAVRAKLGFEISDLTNYAAIEAAPTRSRLASADGGVAVIPILGMISHRMNMMSAMSGGTSTQAVGEALAAATSNAAADSILLDIDSPGGAVSGIQELGAQIREAGKIKPVVAVANTWAASAGYWLASQATELVVTPSGEVGSIGVRAMHQDLSAAYEAEGVRTTMISAGRFKTEASEFEPLTQEAFQAIQASVDSYYADFVAAVATGRGVSKAKVRSGFGEGRMLRAVDAVAEGMADRVETFDAALSRLVGKRRAAARAQAVLTAKRRRLALAG